MPITSKLFRISAVLILLAATASAAGLRAAAPKHVTKPQGPYTISPNTAVKGEGTGGLKLESSIDDAAFLARCRALCDAQPSCGGFVVAPSSNFGGWACKPKTRAGVAAGYEKAGKTLYTKPVSSPGVSKSAGVQPAGVQPTGGKPNPEKLAAALSAHLPADDGTSTEKTAGELLAEFHKLETEDPNNSVETHHKLHTALSELRQDSIQGAQCSVALAKANAEIARLRKALLARSETNLTQGGSTSGTKKNSAQVNAKLATAQKTNTTTKKQATYFCDTQDNCWPSADGTAAGVTNWMAVPVKRVDTLQ